MNINIPFDKNYPEDSVQCDNCGGHGCIICEHKGWHVPANHPEGRRCAYENCRKPLFPDQIALYCSDECAYEDA